MRFLQHIAIVFSLLILSALVLWTCWAHQNKELPLGVSNNSLSWQGYRLNSLKNHSFTAYYSFQDELLSDGIVRNRLRLYPTSFQELKFWASEPFEGRIVEGRWPGKQAIELDRTPLRLSPISVSGPRFALAAWIRHSGLGTIQGPNFGNAASFFALSDGTWSGWRIDLLYPSNRLVFQLARGKENGSIGVVSATRIPPKTWTHIAVSRDEKRMRIFVNGLLSAETTHDAVPTSLMLGTSLKVGYAGNGLASANIQVDEVSCFDSTPESAFFLQESLQLSSEIDIDLKILEKASQAFARGEYGESLIGFQSLLQNTPCNSPLHSIIKYRIAEIYRQLNNDKIAIELFECLAQSTKTLAHVRAMALHDYLAMREGVNSQTDLSTYSLPIHSIDNYPELSSCSERYTNALLEFDFLIPLRPHAPLDFED